MRELRGELGAALRSARIRRDFTAALDAPRRAVASIRRPRRVLVPVLFAIAGLGIIAFFLLSPPAQLDGPPPGNPIVQPGATPLPTLLRGRSTTAVPVVVVPTEEPTERPTSRPTGPVGSPGGVGVGGTPAPVPVGTTRFSGRVVDARNGRGIERACIAIGTKDECGANEVYTDRTGRFAIDLPSGAIWDMKFIHKDYKDGYRRVSSTKTQRRVDLGSIALQIR